jgi:hypothetical protein
MATLDMHVIFMGVLVLLSTSTSIIFIFTLIAILNFDFPYIGGVIIFSVHKGCISFCLHLVYLGYSI